MRSDNGVPAMLRTRDSAPDLIAQENVHAQANVTARHDCRRHRTGRVVLP
ncbi:hypothetical protein UIA24_16565 [Pseudomonas sp. AL 58]|nr:hypothetical protein [Pseudomonas sp. AL 58]